MRSLPRLLAAVLLLVGMLTGGARAAAEDAQAAQLQALDRALVLCQSGHAPGQPRAPAPHVPLCDLAILQSHAASAAILAAAPALPAPLVRPRVAAGAPPQARAPPSYYALAALPRGPPGTV